MEHRAAHVRKYQQGRWCLPSTRARLALLEVRGGRGSSLGSSRKGHWREWGVWGAFLVGGMA